MDDTLTNENVSKLSKNVGSCIESHGFLKAEANRAALFVEEISLTILEKNVNARVRLRQAPGLWTLQQPRMELQPTLLLTS